MSIITSTVCKSIINKKVLICMDIVVSYFPYSRVYHSSTLNSVLVLWYDETNVLELE